MKTLTVFTPTYNREDCLKKLYESLCNQTCNDFVWLVVDDGSTDHTAEQIRKFANEGKIDICYIYQNNGGKHTAHNRGVAECETELFACVDSDDRLSPDAVSVILKKNEEYRDKKVLGYYFRKATESGKLLGMAYPKNLREVGITDLYHKYQYCGETVIVLKTELIKQYEFPVFEGEKFVTERVLYNQLNAIAPMILCEDVIYYAEYLEDGYTKNLDRLQKNNPYGTALDFLLESCYQYSIVEKIKNYAKYLTFVKNFNLNVKMFNSCPAPNCWTQMAAFFLCPHYKELYKRIFEKL